LEGRQDEEQPQQAQGVHGLKMCLTATRRLANG
jgi:hypothetical protein